MSRLEDLEMGDRVKMEEVTMRGIQKKKKK